jgi:NAD(P)-dependent dehydrogenase (short-subunit alcohol dehydrogenase family)
VFGVLAMCRAALGQCREHRVDGREVRLPGGGLYHASKYAIEALSDAMRFELGSFGVDVIVIQPGLTRSDFGSRAVA